MCVREREKEICAREMKVCECVVCGVWCVCIDVSIIFICMHAGMYVLQLCMHVLI